MSRAPYPRSTRPQRSMADSTFTGSDFSSPAIFRLAAGPVGFIRQGLSKLRGNLLNL
jgi:hypothetical protein